MPQGTWWLAWDNARLMAGLAAMAIAATTRSVLWTLAGGFVVLGVWS
jgi:branched-subunit amino acid transport protein